MEYLEVHARLPRIPRRKKRRLRLRSESLPPSPPLETSGHESFWRAGSAPAPAAAGPSQLVGTAAEPIDLSLDSPEPEALRLPPSASAVKLPAIAAATGSQPGPSNGVVRPSSPPAPASPSQRKPSLPTEPSAPRSPRTVQLYLLNPEVPVHPIPEGDDAVLTWDQMRYLGRERPFALAVRCSIMAGDTICDSFLDTANKLIKHVEKVHLDPIRAMSDEKRKTLIVRVGSYPLQHETMADIEDHLIDFVERTIERSCPIIDCPHPRIIKTDPHFKSIALHGTEPLTRRRLRPPLAPVPPVLPPLQSLPGPLPAYLVSCHEIQPFSRPELGVGPRKFSPDNQYPLLPVLCRKGDELTARNGKGFPDDDVGCYWSSEFFRPMMEVDSDDEETVINAPSVLESPRAGMMGKRRAALHGRGRSMSVLSDASYLPPNSGQGSFARGPSQVPSLHSVLEGLGHVREPPSPNPFGFTPPRPNLNAFATPPPPSPNPFEFTPPRPMPTPSRQPEAGPSTPPRSNPTRSAAPTSMTMSEGLSMQPPLGVDAGNGLVRLTRPLRLAPVPERKKNIQGQSAPVIVRPKTFVLREIPNPLQYVKAAAKREAIEKAKREAEEADKQRRIVDEIAALEAERAAWAREREERKRREKARAQRATWATEPLTRNTQEEMEKKAEQFKTSYKRRRPTKEEVEAASHAYARRRTGLTIGIDYWTAVADFLSDHKVHMAAVEQEGGWLDEL